VLFERHAVGGEYQAGYTTVGAGTLETVFTGIPYFVLFWISDILLYSRTLFL
jgi:hypothetical protein